ncbi:L-histidine N(alpha)-methyltransferase [Rhodoferax sp. UBA5149]|uniref:L-histidine N(alpha)-methyltransferase n=1 Tax=Rhodoferax sp. UBA5149 TaxID=1947379 RepID=UPI0025E5027E|nr:L-histidine N(alpha)-methyltransferase [Rhodoferax sp. UBA5149]
MTQVPPLVRTPRFVQLHHDDHAAVRAELASGLQASAAYTSPKYLYDALGSRLFEAITELPEYYPTRTEASIFARDASEMAARIPQGLTLVDLGAGNCQKAARLFDVLRPARYVAVDISVAFLRGALLSLQRQHPALDMVGVGMDFSTTLTLPPPAGEGPRLVFYPGSSIGNFTPAEALTFLRQARQTAQGGGLLIGVDLVKPVSVLAPAYDDALGVTAAFNRNMLLHINRLLGSDFDVSQWRHRALFNARQARIEMHLDAMQDVTVRWPGAQRHFKQGESIHTENSYKYTLQQFEALLREAGFSQVTPWRDAQDWFAVFLARAGS